LQYEKEKAMNTKRFRKPMIFKAMMLLSICLMISGCGPGQLLGPTITPSPTNTPIPTATHTPTPTLTPTATMIPTPSGGGSQIAFSTNRDGNWEIYRMDSEGSNPTRLTTSPSTSDWFPKFSLDGQLLLYWSYTKEPFSAMLQWMQSNGSGGEFASNVAPYTSFAPDGKTVALTEYMGKENMDIFTAPTLAGDPKQLTDSPTNDYQPAWSPDGRTIAFVSDRDGADHIYLMDTDGKNQRRLTQSNMTELEPAWSPDGTTIAFMSSEGMRLTNIYIIASDGENLRPVTTEIVGYNENPVWSPDGTLIAFWSDRIGNHEIYSIKPDGTGLVNLTNDPSDDENPTWAK
jgi:TolB protein